MPTLMLFAPCTAVHVDPQGVGYSLVGIMTQIEMVTAEGASLQIGRVYPFQWVAAAFWRAGPQDRGQRFEEWLQVYSPEGRVAAHARYAFEFSGNDDLVVTQIQLSQLYYQGVGMYNLRLSLRSMKGHGWRKVAEYPLRIIARRP